MRAIVGAIIIAFIGYAIYDEYRWSSSKQQLAFLRERLPSIRCDQAKAVVLTKEDGWQDWYYLTEFQGSADCLASVDRSARAAGFVTKDGALFRDFGKGYGETIRIIPERRSFMWERSQI